MERVPWGTYLWPGLPQLWMGSWPGLGMAIGFAMLLNLAVAANLVWTKLIASSACSLVWGVVVVIWVISTVGTYRWNHRQEAWSQSEPSQNAFTSAQDHYLKGNWFEAERILNGLIQLAPDDVDVGLMRATLFRHTSRHDEALDELRRIASFEHSDKWELEIRREQELLQELLQESNSQGTPSSESATTEINESTETTEITETTEQTDPTRNAA